MPSTDQPIIDYAPVEVEQCLPFIRPMQRWRSACGCCFWVAFIGFFIWPLIAIGAAAAAVVTGIITIYYMGRAARTEVGMGYAARHVALAAFLSIVFLFGVWLVPPLVQSDLGKWHIDSEADKPQTT